MLLESVRVRRFRNFVDSGEFWIEPTVTALVGKNESGKSSILHALYRLKPVNAGYSSCFEVTEEFPRWRLVSDRRAGDLEELAPIRATFGLEASDRAALGSVLGVEVPDEARVAAERTYGNRLRVSVSRAAGEMVELTGNARDLVVERLPGFFYFSSYSLLPGRIDLHEVLKGGGESQEGSAPAATARALLRFAGVEGTEFLDDQFESRRAEIESAARDLTQQVFEYWTQNRELSVELNDEYKRVAGDPGGQPVFHRFLDVRLRDERHGGVTTNFSTRSYGFQWFFSFLAAFSAFEHEAHRVVVLLDEVGTSLHGEAQRDFLRFVLERLGSQQQVIYATHSQHMVDPARYEQLRAVEDRATTTDPNRGAVVTLVADATDRTTVLPIQAALGQSIIQQLFLDTVRHLVVEDAADFVYLTELSKRLGSKRRPSLAPDLVILPIGGADQIPALVALLSRHASVRLTLLLNGGEASRHVRRVRQLIDQGGIPAVQVVLCSEILHREAGADLEDIFHADDYLRLVNWMDPDTHLSSQDLPVDRTRIVSRVASALGHPVARLAPATQLTAHRAEFVSALRPETITRFDTLFKRLNATLP